MTLVFVAACLAVVAIMAAPATAMAPEAAETTPAFRVSGSAGLVSDYRFRGVSQSDEDAAVQASLTLSHRSGAYAGLWVSNLAGWGSFGGPDLELDLIAGYRLPVADGTLDLGLTWYTYPGGAGRTDFVEPYARVSGTLGPVSLLAGVAYAPAQVALGNWSATPQSRIGDRDDNLYLWGDAAAGVPGTPVTVKAHIGYSDGNPGLGPNGTSVAPTGTYWDWLIGADVVFGPVTLGIAYTDTGIGETSARYLRLQPNFSSTEDGSSISAGQVVFSVTAAF